MCGGAGTRLWPAARENRPKQFLPLFGPLSTFQETIRRVSDPALFGRPIIVTNGQYRFLVAEQLAAIGAEAEEYPVIDEAVLCVRLAKEAQDPALWIEAPTSAIAEGAAGLILLRLAALR